MRIRHQALLPFLLIIATLGLVACGPGPKSPELQTLSRLRNEAQYVQLKRFAPKETQMIDKLHISSRHAWEDGEESASREYAVLGKIYFRAAEMRRETQKEVDRLKKADAKIEEFSKKIKTIKDDIATSEEQVGVLEKGKKVAAKAADKTGEATQALRLLEAERAKADGVEALKLAPGIYARAENTMKMAKKMIQDENYAQGIKLANEARMVFLDALKIAKPKFQANNQLRELEAAAKRDFSSDSFKDGRGVGVIIPRLFKKKGKKMDKSKGFILEMVAGMASKYSATNIIVEGHTRDSGSDSSNTKLSEKRAAVVEGALIDMGVSASRITTIGHGEDNLRYDTDDRDLNAKNDRVEIIFVMPRK